jgi:hypothetical protein
MLVGTNVGTNRNVGTTAKVQRPIVPRSAMANARLKTINAFALSRAFNVDDVDYCAGVTTRCVSSPLEVASALQGDYQSVASGLLAHVITVTHDIKKGAATRSDTAWYQRW